jgi:hypothetical protein
VRCVGNWLCVIMGNWEVHCKNCGVCYFLRGIFEFLVRGVFRANGLPYRAKESTAVPCVKLLKALVKYIV